MIEKILYPAYENNAKKINEVIEKVNEITEVGGGAKFVSINSDNQDEANFFGDGATGNNAIAIGTGTKSENTDSVAIGTKTKAVNSCTVAIGEKAQAQDVDSIAIGSKTKAQGNDSVSIGTKTKTQGSNTVAIGTQAKARGDNAVAIGNNAATQEELISAIAIGGDSIATEENTVSFGHQATDYINGSDDEDIYGTAVYRRLVNVADGINDTDAVNVRQLTEFVQEAIAAALADL